MELIMGGLRGLFGVKSAPTLQSEITVRDNDYSVKYALCEYGFLQFLPDSTGGGVPLYVSLEDFRPFRRSFPSYTARAERIT